MAIELNKNPISDQTKRSCAAGLYPEFLGEMAESKSALQVMNLMTNYYGYTMHGNHQYITKIDGAREIVTKMDVKEIKIFQKHYKEHR